jgi:RecJ-like exonuclease
VRFYRPRTKPKELKKKMADISRENKRLAKENQKLSKKPENPKKSLKKRYCPFCKTGVSEEFDYCPKCAGKVHMIRKCPECGSINLKDEKFKYCPNCGK